ncbi:MAG TPA: hypothetical protein VF331_26750 [Polyangiales bacterium]
MKLASGRDKDLSELYRRHVSRYVAMLERVECWLLHPAPASTVESCATFAPAVVRFAAPHCGFVLPLAAFDEPIVGSEWACGYFSSTISGLAVDEGRVDGVVVKLQCPGGS